MVNVTVLVALKLFEILVLVTISSYVPLSEIVVPLVYDWAAPPSLDKVAVLVVPVSSVHVALTDVR